MTPIKEALETGNSLAESELSRGKSRSKPQAGHSRPDAVSLELPVKVHGSLVSNIAPGGTPQAQPFEEQTTTMIVFPQGGVLKMSTGVSAGQVMVVTNLKSRQDAICRAVKVRSFGKEQGYVEIEFTSPQPGYWGVRFTKDGPEVAKMAPPKAAASAEPVSGAPHPGAPPASVPSVSTPVAKRDEAGVPAEAAQRDVVPPSPPPRRKLPESMFASIGTKEEVQPAAASTKVPRNNPFIESGAKRPASTDSDISAAIDALIEPSLPSAPSSAKTEKAERGSATLPDASEKISEPPASAPNLLGGESESALASPKQMFGVALDSPTPLHEQSAKSSASRMLIPIGIAALLAVAAGGAYYYHGKTAANQAVAAPDSASQPAVATTQPEIEQNTVAPTAEPNSSDAVGTIPPVSGEVGQTSAVAPSGTLRESRAGLTSRDEVPARKASESGKLAVRHENSPSQAASKGTSPKKSQPNSGIPNMVGALTSRPVIQHHASVDSAGTAPALEPSGSPAATDGALSGIAPPQPSLPAPRKPGPTGPVRVGGKILPPKIISSVLPVYPPLAQQAGASGTVVVDTIIDKEGRVAKMKIVSGPILLRDAALNALRQWRYAPSKLNGQPISVEMIVSIRFHR